MNKRLQQFISKFDIQEHGNYIILYKTAYSNGHSILFGAGRAYKVGALVKTPRMCRSISEQCGQGLHCSPFLAAKSWYGYSSGRSVFEVAIKKSSSTSIPEAALHTIKEHADCKIRCKELQVLRVVTETELFNEEIDRSLQKWRQ